MSLRLKMNCPECNTILKKIEVNVAGAKSKVISYQCPKCDYFEFEPLSPKKHILLELKD